MRHRLPGASSALDTVGWKLLHPRKSNPAAPEYSVNLPIPNALDSYLAAGPLIPNNVPRTTSDLDKLPTERLRHLVISGQPALSHLRSGLKRSYGIHIHPSFSTLRPEISVFRKLALLQHAEAVFFEREDEVEASRQAHLREVAFGAQISHGGLILDALIAMKMQQDGLRGLERLSDRFSYESAAGTARLLERLEASSASAIEVVLRNNLYEQAGVVELMWIARNGSAKDRSDYHTPWISGWDPAYAMTSKSQMLDAFRQYAEGVAAHSSTPYWKRSAWPPPPNDPVNTWVGLTYEDPVFKFDLNKASFRLVQAKLAMRAYRQRYRRPVSRIDDLTPGLLASVQDPFSGNPLRLKGDATTSRQLIYSVGPDKKDDGGQPIKTGIGRTSLGDLVEVPTR